MPISFWPDESPAENSSAPGHNQRSSELRDPRALARSIPTRPLGRLPEAVKPFTRLNRNDVVENGEHTPLACGLRRRAANFSPTAVLDQTVGRFVRTKPTARRRRQHAGRMRSPFSTASFRLRGSGATGKNKTFDFIERKRCRAPLATAVQNPRPTPGVNRCGFALK